MQNLTRVLAQFSAGRRRHPSLLPPLRDSTVFLQQCRHRTRGGGLRGPATWSRRSAAKPADEPQPRRRLIRRALLLFLEAPATVIPPSPSSPLPPLPTKVRTSGPPLYVQFILDRIQILCPSQFKFASDSRARGQFSGLPSTWSNPSPPAPLPHLPIKVHTSAQFFLVRLIQDSIQIFSPIRFKFVSDSRARGRFSGLPPTGSNALAAITSYSK
jgi:hypothetical protein